MKKIVIIGGSDAGISAGLRAKETAPDADVIILVKDRFPNFSICGLPFYIGGEIPDWFHLAHRTQDQLKAAGLRVLPGHEAIQIKTQTHTVAVRDPEGSVIEFSYDCLVIATGAASARPRIPGSDLPGIFFLRFMDDGLKILEYLTNHPPKQAAIIGTGYIGMEMAEALIRQNLPVTMIEMADSVMPSFDPKMGALLQSVLTEKGIRVETGVTITDIGKTREALMLRSGDKTIAAADFILIAAGACPAVDLAADSGIALGKTGAIAVNEKMETSANDIYAAGDCVETFHRLINTYTYMPLGTTAHKQGRAAGENAAGGNAEFAGILGTQSLKIFDRVAARTGLSHAEAEAAGFSPFSVHVRTPDHKAYYPGASFVNICLTGDRLTQKLLGAQIMGHHGAEISKRIDILASALYSGLGVDEIPDLDLSYTPPLSSPWDPVQTAAMEWLSEINPTTGWNI